MSDKSDNNYEPSRFELDLLSTAGRISRLRKEGMSLGEALAKIGSTETAEEYVARNKEAMDDVTARILSPEYMQRYEEAQSEPDPDLRAQKLADIKRDNFATMDLEALHRTISARNRQMKAEGLLPPDVEV